MKIGPVNLSSTDEEPLTSAINDQRHQLLIKPDPARGRHASPGETITFSCISKGAAPAPKLSFVIEGRNVSEIAGANVREISVAEALNGGSSYGGAGYSDSPSRSGAEEGVAILGTILEVTEDLFRNLFVRGSKYPSFRSKITRPETGSLVAVHFSKADWSGKVD